MGRLLLVALLCLAGCAHPGGPPAREPAAASASKPETEFRGVWVRPPADPDRIPGILDAVAAAGFNTVLVETLYHGFTIFPGSEVPPRPEYGQRDVLAEFIREARARGLAVHAWTQVFYLQVDTRRHPHLPRSPLLDAHPDWRVTDRAGRASDHNGGGHVFGDPANPRLRAFLLGYFEYLLDHYAVDGIALDYVRYPSGADDWGYTGHARAAFREEHGIDPLEIDPLRDPLLQQAWDGWRERQVTALVAGVRGLVDRRRPSIRLAAAVFPNYYAAGGEHAIRQDWAGWLDAGLLDAVLPMAYADNLDGVRGQIRQVTTRNPDGVAVIPVLGFAAQAGPAGPPPAYPPIRSQIELARSLGLAGYSVFCHDWIAASPAGYAELH